MAKSKLSTAEMKRLREAGIPIAMIAQLAGITSNGVRNRLRSRAKRQTKEYVFSSPRSKRDYLTKQRDRQQEYQRKSVGRARNFGAWTASEVRFLEKNASDLTLLQLAMILKRTYHSVSHFINRHRIKTRK